MSITPDRVFHRSVPADGVNVFYRESGDPALPALLLVHGFPASSFMYRHLLTELSDAFHVVAPDLPGFGFTEVPEDRDYDYTFDALAETLREFVNTIGLQSYVLYVFDYGAPVGLRLAVSEPQRVRGLISQNGNVYLEGLGEAFAPVRKYWATPNEKNFNALRSLLTLDATKWQYEKGVADTALLAPETYTLDYTLLQRPGNEAIQLQLFHDYQQNLLLYPAFQSYLRQFQPKTLVIWGKNDPFFNPRGAEAYLRHVPNAEIELLDTGHFALETHSAHIAQRIRAFFAST